MYATIHQNQPLESFFNSKKTYCAGIDFWSSSYFVAPLLNVIVNVFAVTTCTRSNVAPAPAMVMNKIAR